MWWVAYAAVLAAAGLAIACSPRPVVPLLEELDAASMSSVRPQWPPPPAPARVVYLGAVSGRRAFDPRRSLWEQIQRVFGTHEDVAFVRPFALCARAGMLAVADPGAGAVHRLDLYERRWKTIRETPDGVLRSPVGVACLPGGRIAVADSVTHRVWLYDESGAPQGALGTQRLDRPTGLSFDEINQRLWVAETLAHRVRAFDLDGRELLRVGSRGSGPRELNYPTMLASDPDGGVWLTDSLNFRLQHLDSAGRLDRRFGRAGDGAGYFARPRGLAVDASGRVFVVDALFDAVQIFDSKGRLLLVFGERGTGAGQLWLPSDVAFDGEGHVFVADAYNQRVQVFRYQPPGPD